MAWSATHYPGELYDRLGALHAVTMVFLREGDVIGRVRVTRGDYATWDYRGKMGDVVKAQDVVSEAREAGRLSWKQADARYKQISSQAHWDLLGLLPDGATEIARKYRPAATPP